MKTKKNQKQVSVEEYVEKYCQEKRIRERFAVYVSPQTHSKLKTTVRLFANKHHTTTSSLADSIISRHFETHRELLTEVHEEDKREFLEWLKNLKRRGSDESEEQSDDVDE